MFIFAVQLTTSRISSLTQLTHTLVISDDHRYIHTWGFCGQDANSRQKKGSLLGKMCFSCLFGWLCLAKVLSRFWNLFCFE